MCQEPSKQESRVRLSRVLHELEAQGLIAIDKRDIRVLDVARLASYGSH